LDAGTVLSLLLQYLTVSNLYYKNQSAAIGSPIGWLSVSLQGF